MPEPRLPDLGAWLRHFESNARRRPEPAWETDRPLSDAERRAVARSIATFQLGESSEGRTLLRLTEREAARLGDPRLVAITRLFIAEEQRHAALLAGFMARQGIPLRRRAGSDAVFRRLRALAGYELSVAVLIVAEIIALPYYRALREATGSPVLRAICERLLADEAAHVRFEARMLRALRARRRPWRRRAEVLLHRLLFAGAVCVVIAGHRRVLARAGVAAPDFWREAWLGFDALFERASDTRPVLASGPARPGAR